jgi:hypothetical protein
MSTTAHSHVNKILFCNFHSILLNSGLPNWNALTSHENTASSHPCDFMAKTMFLILKCVQNVTACDCEC